MSLYDANFFLEGWLVGGGGEGGVVGRLGGGHAGKSVLRSDWHLTLEHRWVQSELVSQKS